MLILIMLGVVFCSVRGSSLSAGSGDLNGIDKVMVFLDQHFLQLTENQRKTTIELLQAKVDLMRRQGKLRFADEFFSRSHMPLNFCYA
jgi:hypothetical protein